MKKEINLKSLKNRLNLQNEDINKQNKMALWSELECEKPDEICEQIKKSLEKSRLMREYDEIIFDKENESIFRTCYKENKKHYAE